jgi:hypothetical protein
MNESMSVQVCCDEGFNEVSFFTVWYQGRLINRGITTEDGWFVWFADKVVGQDDCEFLLWDNIVEVERE